MYFLGDLVDNHRTGSERSKNGMRRPVETDRQTFDRAALLRRGAVAGALLGFAGAVPELAQARRSAATLNLVAYSTPKTVMLAPESAFAATSRGSGIGFTNSFGPSTSQANA